MFVIGLTGSIAMGKTTTARLFAEEGVPVHDADAAVHQLYEGEAVGARSRRHSRARPRTARSIAPRSASGWSAIRRRCERLEAIVHPLVRNAERASSCGDAEAAGARIVVLDIPLLFETGGEQRVDAMVVVSAPAEVQRARVLERGVSPEQLEALLARQMPDAEKRRRADFVVDSSQGDRARARRRCGRFLTAVAKMPTRRK